MRSENQGLVGRSGPLAATVGLLIGALVLLVGPIGSASAYSKPAKGGWSVEQLFSGVKGGSMKVAKNRKKVKKLTIKYSDDSTDACGKKATIKGLKVRAYKQAGGRYAYAKLPKKTGLFEPKPTKIKVGGKRMSGKLMLLFDQSGKLVSSARIEYRACSVDFLVRK